MGALSCPRPGQSAAWEAGRWGGDSDCVLGKKAQSREEGEKQASHWLLEHPLPPSRFSQMVQDKPLRTSWQRKMKDRQERKLAKDFSQHLEEEKERRRRRENLKRRLEREAEIVQVIRNPAKLKRAKQQQLRSIEKPDTLTQLQKPPPQRPAAEV